MTQNILLTIVLFISGFLYLPLNRRKAVYYWKTKFDNKVPLIRLFIIPYIFLLPLEIFAFFALFNTPLYPRFAITYTVVRIFASIFWYYFPNGVKRSAVPGNDLLSKVINYIYNHDGETNGFPSGHVFGSLILCHFLSILYGPWWYIIGILISLSTVFVKQHYVVDIAGGIIWAIAGITITNIFI